MQVYNNPRLSNQSMFNRRLLNVEEEDPERFSNFQYYHNEEGVLCLGVPDRKTRSIITLNTDPVLTEEPTETNDQFLVKNQKINSVHILILGVLILILVK